MALTPEQILNKHFQTTQFRKGYDERDVDDFLDDVVAEMRALVGQRDDLKHQLDEVQSGRGSQNGSDGHAGEVDESQLAGLRARISEAESKEKEIGKRLSKAQADVAAAEAQVRDRQGAIDASVQERLDAAETRAREASEAGAAAEQRVSQLEGELQRAKQSAAEAQEKVQAPEQRAEASSAAAAEAHEKVQAA
ncbi:MAG: DivIVA domain-containing protein, partial [Actinomycetota bacterium]|nr:DivIVA domain-containing protein [Actinomycetota bacterium]